MKIAKLHNNILVCTLKIIKNATSLVHPSTGLSGSQLTTHKSVRINDPKGKEKCYNTEMK
jgi:hypothetical protein